MKAFPILMAGVGVAALAVLVKAAGEVERVELDGRSYRVYPRKDGVRIHREYEGHDAIVATFTKGDDVQSAHILISKRLQDDPELQKRIRLEMALDMVYHHEQFHLDPSPVAPEEVERIIREQMGLPVVSGRWSVTGPVGAWIPALFV